MAGQQKRAAVLQGQPAQRQLGSIAGIESANLLASRSARRRRQDDSLPQATNCVPILSCFTIRLWAVKQP